MDVNDDAYCLDKRVAQKSIASKLAPTGEQRAQKRAPLAPFFIAPP
ncbi:hypothetical protein PMI33_01148 [Pseudomonas sp. GM67]|nr:hypothetical protein PMI33_01148 [Pseudomonas sp. GM67]